MAVLVEVPPPVMSPFQVPVVIAPRDGIIPNRLASNRLGALPQNRADAMSYSAGRQASTSWPWLTDDFFLGQPSTWKTSPAVVRPSSRSAPPRSPSDQSIVGPTTS